MQLAYIHMLTNHVPILGTFFGIFLLACGFVSHNQTLKTAAYMVFALAAVGGVIANLTGDAAAHLAKTIPGVTRERIKAHEESADLTTIAMCLLGAASLAGLWFGRMKPAYNRMLAVGIGILSLIALGLAARTGQLGGKIRHTEFAGPASAAALGTAPAADPGTAPEAGKVGAPAESGGQ